MGDWGLQMGLIITELQERKPELVYFDDASQVNIRRRRLRSLNWKKSIRQPAADPRKILPIKKKQWKQRKSCKTAYVGIVLSGDHIISVSVSDLKKNYNNLNVQFDLWNGESTVHDIIPGMVDYMKKEGYAHESDGALVVDVKKETDTERNPALHDLKIRRCFSLQYNRSCNTDDAP